MKILFTLFLIFVTRLAHADGGAIQFQGDSGRFHITVFTLPSILRAGPIDITALVQDKTSLDPLLDADVHFGLTLLGRGAPRDNAWLPPSCAWTPSAGVTDVQARLNHGENKLLYGALVQIPRSGHWNLDVKIGRGAEQTSISTSFFVNPPSPPGLAYWRLFIIPPIGIAGFVLHQRARDRRKRVGRARR